MWVYAQEPNKTLGARTTWEKHNDSTCFSEDFLEAVRHTTAFFSSLLRSRAVVFLGSLTNGQSKDKYIGSMQTLDVVWMTCQDFFELSPLFSDYIYIYIYTYTHIYISPFVTVPKSVFCMLERKRERGNFLNIYL